MKRILMLTLVILSVSAMVMAQTGERRQGMIVRMRMTDCMPAEHGFMAVMAGGATHVDTGLQCPEYVLVTDNVVYAISGKTADQLLPLAETTYFRLQKNEMLIRVDDAAKESHFRIKAMVMRPEWERSQNVQIAEANAAINRGLETEAVRPQH